MSFVFNSRRFYIVSVESDCCNLLPTQSTIQRHLVQTRLFFLRPKINAQNINIPTAVWDHFKKGKDDPECHIWETCKEQGR